MTWAPRNKSEDEDEDEGDGTRSKEESPEKMPESNETSAEDEGRRGVTATPAGRLHPAPPSPPGPGQRGRSGGAAFNKSAPKPVPSRHLRLLRSLVGGQCLRPRWAGGGWRCREGLGGEVRGAPRRSQPVGVDAPRNGKRPGWLASARPQRWRGGGRARFSPALFCRPS